MYKSIGVVKPTLALSDPMFELVNGKFKSNITMLALIYDHTTRCPVCDILLISVDKNKRRCMSCHVYLMYWYEDLKKVVDARGAAGVYTTDIDVPAYPGKAIYSWDSEMNTYVELYSPS